MAKEIQINWIKESDCLAGVAHCYDMSERAFLIPACPLSSRRGITFISSENGAMINSVHAKTALPGGYRNNNNGNYNNMGNNGYFWSATENNSNNAWNRKLNYNNSDINRNNNNKRNGFSVRCVRELAQSDLRICAKMAHILAVIPSVMGGILATQRCYH